MLNAARHAAVPRPLLAGAAAVVACGLALSGPALPFPVPAAAAIAARQQPGGSSPVSVAITSVNPQYAEPGKTVRVSGTLTNTSPDAISGLSVQLLSSSSPFDNRSELQQYARGTFTDGSPVLGADTLLTASLAPHATVNWSVSLNPDEVPISGSFGVYPLAAQVEDADLDTLSVSRTFLPFWPNSKAQDPSAQQQIAWIWPLIDQPRQGACTGLLNNGLASSLAPGGRLGGLLDAGATYASSAHLTWAIDPALLASVNTMTTSYQVSGAACRMNQTHPASQAATTWLDQLKVATSGQPVFLTPYDDADIAALVGNNMNADLTHSFAEGRAVAGKVLGRTFNVTATAGPTSLNGTVWPADGIANYAVLENLAASDQINTVVLDSTTMPPSQQQTYTPSAQSTTPDGVGPPLNVLLSDDTITQILGSADAPSTSAATSFSVAQSYLAETAMIAAERPNLARSIVVAPPRSWDPPAGLADQLLSETTSAPWLRTVSLAALASAKNPTGVVNRQSPTASSNAELGRPLLDQARQLDAQADALESIQASPDQAYVTGLNNAVAAAESSAWRGDGAAGLQGSAQAQAAILYLSGQEGKVTVFGAPRVTLGGLTGSVPVSVQNELGFPVKVALQATSTGRVTVHQPRRVITVPAGQLQVVKLQVAATTVGSNTLRVSLVTPQGVPLQARTSIIVQATHYGDLALIVIAAALGVFLLTSAARAFRRAARRRRENAAPPDGPDGAAGASPAEDHGPERPEPDIQPSNVGPDQRGLPDEAGGPDTVVPGGRTPGQATTQPTAQTPARDRGEATDDYAWAPGQAERR
jgi:Family of unknown function (DUF6049)